MKRATLYRSNPLVAFLFLALLFSGWRWIYLEICRLTGPAPQTLPTQPVQDSNTLPPGDVEEKEPLEAGNAAEQPAKEQQLPAPSGQEVTIETETGNISLPSVLPAELPQA